MRAQDPADAARALETTDADFAIVVTHDHDLDQRIVQELLRKPLKFTGMIGSLGKLAKFRRRLETRGFTAEQVARLRTPLGLPIGAQTPEEIAVSVLAELVAVRRETAPDKGWEEAARTRHRRSRRGMRSPPKERHMNGVLLPRAPDPHEESQAASCAGRATVPRARHPRAVVVLRRRRRRARQQRRHRAFVAREEFTELVESGALTADLHEARRKERAA